MASATKIVLSPDVRGYFHSGERNPEAAKRVSELLQHNLDHSHMYQWNRRHNHTVHHVLTAYYLGASADDIQEVFDRTPDTRWVKPQVSEQDVKAMEDKSRFSEFYDQPKNYSSFLVFFQRQIEAKGLEEVLFENLFAGDEHADEMLFRSYGSILHTLIHLGFAIESEQPALVAEALAMAATHERFYSSALLRKFFLATERVAGGPALGGEKSLRQIMEVIRNDKHLSTLSHHDNELDRCRTVVTYGLDEIAECIGQYKVSPDQIEDKLSEMNDVLGCLCGTMSDSTVDKYQVNFFIMHQMNFQVFAPALRSLRKYPRIPARSIARMVEWKGRYDLLVYTGESAPEVSTKTISDYPASNFDWKTLFAKGLNHPTDDGHLAKVLRAYAFAEQAQKLYKKPADPLMKEGMWLKLANMAFDSVPQDAVESTTRWFYQRRGWQEITAATVLGSADGVSSYKL